MTTASRDDKPDPVDNPPEGTIRRIVAETETIAVVGASRSETKDAHTVPRYLQAAGYDIWPVNPNADRLFGRAAPDSLQALIDDDRRPDMVLFFRPGDEIPRYRQGLLELEPEVVWLQQGIRHDATARALAQAGITPVQDLCLRTMHMFHAG